MPNKGDQNSQSYREVQHALVGLKSGGDVANLPPDVPLIGVDLPFPMPNYCGDFEMRILTDGTWLYQNSPIGRKPLCKLFASVMHRDNKGDYWLVTPAERGRIQVDIAPFTFVEYQQDGDDLKLRSNLDEWVTLNAEHPFEMAQVETVSSPLPLVTLRGRLQGLVVRSLFYQLVEIAKMRELPDNKQELYLVSGTHEFSLGCFKT